MNKFFLFFILIVFFPTVKAIPGLPNQFYGSVTYLNDSISDGHKVTAKLAEEEFTVNIIDGKYGIETPLLVSKDSSNNVNEINFYIDNKKILTQDYNPGELTKLNLDVPSNIVVIKKTTVKNLKLRIGKSNDLSEEFKGIQEIEFEENNKRLVKFDYDFDKHTIKDLFKNMIIKKQGETAIKGSIMIKGTKLPYGKTKTVYIDNLNEDSDKVCIKDVEIDSINEISNTCKGENEILITCNSLEQNGYRCTLIEDKYEIIGLFHSGVQEHTPICGDGVCDDDETCSACPEDCGECPATTSSDSSKRITICIEDWECKSLFKCRPDGTRRRLCIDKNSCGTTLNKPSDIEECVYEGEEIIYGAKEIEEKIQQKELNSNKKTFSIILLIVVGIIGIIIYFLIKKRKIIHMLGVKYKKNQKESKKRKR